MQSPTIIANRRQFPKDFFRAPNSKETSIESVKVNLNPVFDNKVLSPSAHTNKHRLYNKVSQRQEYADQNFYGSQNAKSNQSFHLKRHIEQKGPEPQLYGPQSYHSMQKQQTGAQANLSPKLSLKHNFQALGLSTVINS